MTDILKNLNALYNRAINREIIDGGDILADVWNAIDEIKALRFQRFQKSETTKAGPMAAVVFDFETVAINTRIDNQEDLEELVLRLQQIKSMLPKESPN